MVGWVDGMERLVDFERHTEQGGLYNSWITIYVVMHF